MFAPLRFPSFHSEKSEKAEKVEKDARPRTSDPELRNPRSEMSPATEGINVVVDEAHDHGDEKRLETGVEQLESGEEMKLARRMSRMELFAHYIFPSLTPEPTDQLPLKNGVHRKPVPATYFDTSMTTVFLDPENGLPTRESPTKQQHSRTASIPNILRKVRKSSPDMRANGDDAPSLPPKPTTVPPGPSVAEPQASAPRLKNTRERTRSNSVESGQPQSKLQTYDGPSSPRIRSSSAQPPTVRNGYTDPARIVSAPPRDVGSHSRTSSTGEGPHPEGRKLKRLFGGSRSGSQDASKKSGAWILGPDSNVDYNTSFLISGDKVSRLTHSRSEQG